jgi:glutaredoxin
MELKEQIKQELLEKKEQERLERVKANSKLKKVNLLTNGTPYCNTIKEQLDQEGIKYLEKSDKKEIDKAVAITNLNMFPMVNINDVYLVNGRDFTNPQQLVQGITHMANPNYENPSSDLKTLEHIKTVQYHLWQKLNRIEQSLNPITGFITNLQKEIAEEKSE